VYPFAPTTGKAQPAVSLTDSIGLAAASYSGQTAMLFGQRDIISGTSPLLIGLVNDVATVDPSKLNAVPEILTRDLGLMPGISLRFATFSDQSQPILLASGPRQNGGVSFFWIDLDGGVHAKQPNALLTQANVVAVSVVATTPPQAGLGDFPFAWVERDTKTSTDTIRFSHVTCR
jgi:hypothetical protein